MKFAVNLIRVIVGVLFIFSGLIKANDPHGLSYKMQEFFELWGAMQFNSATLSFAVLMNAFEIIAGFAILIGWQKRIFCWLLLLLIIFFTFLTGYAHFSGKFQNCGCFGDCLPISTWTSFMKDIVLLIFITFLFLNQRFISPLFNYKVNWVLMSLVTLFSFGIQWYTLRYLPIYDCLPYKKGKNIADQMKIPVGARPDSFAIRFVYERDGKEYEFSPAELPADLATYKFVSRKDKLIRKGNADAPIKGFLISGETDIDSTTIVLQQPYAVLLFAEEIPNHELYWKERFAAIHHLAASKNIPAYIITTQRNAALTHIASTSFRNVPVFKCDFTAIRTAARANPCIYVLKKGTILGKWSYPGMNKARKLIESFPSQKIQDNSTVDTTEVH